MVEIEAYANDNHIEIVGDMPIYVAEDSSDMWANPHLFKTDVNGKATCIAGCPPDEFSATGSSFGVTQSNDWGSNGQKTDTNGGLNACVKASKSTTSFVLTTSVVSNLTGKSLLVPIQQHLGEWVKGPGYKLFAAVKEELGELNIIAEDLGNIDDKTRQLLADCGYPGMKIVQFGFYDTTGNSIDIPHVYTQHSVAYTGTHDNE